MLAASPRDNKQAAVEQFVAVHAERLKQRRAITCANAPQPNDSPLRTSADRIHRLLEQRQHRLGRLVDVVQQEGALQGKGCAEVQSNAFIRMATSTG